MLRFIHSFECFLTNLKYILLESFTLLTNALQKKAVFKCSFFR